MLVNATPLSKELKKSSLCSSMEDSCWRKSHLRSLLYLLVMNGDVNIKIFSVESVQIFNPYLIKHKLPSNYVWLKNLHHRYDKNYMFSYQKLGNVFI